MAVQDVLDRFRQPRYTGENRCLPCTGVNVAIAVVLAGALGGAALASGVGAGGAALAGTVAFLLSTGVIYLRGYLVPGTPWLTKRYLPDRVHRRFDDHSSGAATAGAFDVAETLTDAGAVTECEDADDLCLTDGFRTAWRERIGTVRAEPTPRTELARLLDVDPGGLSIEEHGAAFVARVDGRRVGQWESRAAFLADVAAAAELRDRYPEWPRIDLEHRSAMLNGLRIFLERCPACEGRVSLDQEVVESCCRAIDVVAVTCQDCGARVFETDRPG